MIVRIGVACLVILLTAGSLISCGGGGGGGGAPLSPPAFTNLAATRWTHRDTVSATNSCNAGIGVYDQYVLHVLAQSGNTISIYDETHASQLDAKNATISGYIVTYVGDRYPIGGCSSMSANYTMTINGAGTSYSGSGTITCNDSPACSVPVNITGTKLP